MTARPLLAIGAVVALAMSCRRDVFIGSDGVARGAIPDAGVIETPDVVVTCTPITCGGALHACGDCDDNDGDGTVDMADPDCLGPCHDAEDNFRIPVPGGGPPCTLDCYFDGNNGFGNDQCVWSHRCDALAVAPDFPPEGESCAYDPGAKIRGQATCDTSASEQPAKCTGACLPLVPNGCDCFGCCAVPGGPTFWLGSTDESGKASCDLAHVSDPARCKPCTQVPSCVNPCDTCERCIGKATLPASCTTGNGCETPECTRGAPCGSPCLAPCAAGEACITGCCAVIPR